MPATWKNESSAPTSFSLSQLLALFEDVQSERLPRHAFLICAVANFDMFELNISLNWIDSFDVTFWCPSCNITAPTCQLLISMRDLDFAYNKFVRSQMSATGISFKTLQDDDPD